VLILIDEIRCDQLNTICVVKFYHKVNILYSLSVIFNW